MCCPSATLGVWTSAWLHGVAASDDAIDALLPWGEAHEFVAADEATAAALGIPVAGSVPASPAELLPAVRRAGATGAWLVLPVPGDARGLGGGGPFTDAALRAGEAVVLAGAGSWQSGVGGPANYGMVPEPIAEGLMRWTCYAVDVAQAPDFGSLGEAEHALTDAIRDSAGALQSLDVASDRPGVRAELSAKLRATPRPDWPSGMPGKTLRVLQRADEVSAIVALAHADEPGGALSASAASRRADALRPLVAAIRGARCAAVNEAIRAFAGTSETSE